MRLTRDILIKIARDAAEQRIRVSRRIICVYLTGSVLEDSPLLGGTTDIDLVIIHDSDPIKPREIVRLSDEVHLDICHYAQSVFHQPRHLRADPWLGPFIYNKPLVFHDTQHWFDFAQAALGSHFLQPDHVMQRAGALSALARQTWMDLEFQPATNHARQVYRYYKVLENAGNTLASLNSRPLTERRFFLQLPQVLQELDQQEITSEMTHLVIPDLAQLESSWPEWTQSWKETYQRAASQENAPARINPNRLPYYDRAITALWETSPIAAAWLLMRTWALAISHLPENEPIPSAWQASLKTLQLDEESFPQRVQLLDHLLDRVEETLDAWGQSNGVIR